VTAREPAPPRTELLALRTELLALALDAAGRAADLLADGSASRRRDVATKSSGTDMVTDMDRAAEALIVRTLLGVRPADAVLGEEGGERAGTSGVRWIVDPLDGTTNYLYGHPGYAVSIAAEVDGVVEVGVVADVSRNETFSASRGGRSHLEDVALAGSTCTDLAQALVATGFSYRPEQRTVQAARLRHVLPVVRDIRRNGAAAIDLCWVACGRVDAYYETDVQPWDVAAGLLIAEEAGMATTGIDGGPATGASVLAAAPALVEPLQALLQEPPRRRYGRLGVPA